MSLPTDIVIAQRDSSGYHRSFIYKVLADDWLHDYKVFKVDLRYFNGKRYKFLSQSWNGRTWSVRLPTKRGDSYLEYKLCVLCFDIQRSTNNEPCQSFHSGVCASCRVTPIATHDYYRSFYRSLLSSPYVGKDFEHSFRKEMLLYGYSCTVDEHGSIQVGDKVPTGIRSSGSTTSYDASNESDAVPYEMGVYSPTTLQPSDGTTIQRNSRGEYYLRYDCSDEDESP